MSWKWDEKGGSTFFRHSEYIFFSEESNLKRFWNEDENLIDLDFENNSIIFACVFFIFI